MALTVALAAFWALAINHCRLEAVSEFELLTCSSQAEHSEDHPSNHQPNDCEGDSCAAVEDGFYKASETYVFVKEPNFGPIPFAVAASSTTLDIDSLDAARATEDGLVRLASPWQFSVRAAPAPRAPAHVS
jgi:hypothetical protein